MTQDDMDIYRRILSEVQGLISNKVKLGVANLPLEFNGITSSMLYEEGVSNEALVLFIAAIIDECKGKDKNEILERFRVVEAALTVVYGRN